MRLAALASSMRGTAMSVLLACALLLAGCSGWSQEPGPTTSPTGTTSSPSATTAAPSSTSSATSTQPPPLPPPSQSPPAGPEVHIRGGAFTPKTMEVTVGTTVQWNNVDGIAHTVTADAGGAFDSGQMPPNSIFTHEFTAGGTYAYHCGIHPGMKATVVVT